MSAITTEKLTKRFISRKRAATGASGSAGADTAGVHGNGGPSGNGAGGRGPSGLLGRFRRPAKSETLAVDAIDLDLREGEIFGLLGPNGAGKTTTIRMLCTLLEPTSGRATVAGYDVVKEADKVRASIGVVLSGERAVYWKLTGRENLQYYAALYHIPPAAARKRIAEILAVVNLADRADEFVERYSSGMKQRLTLAKGLLNNPPVLLLDEPTIGLDPQSARNIREFILCLNKEHGKTVILTTHYMEEADQLCDRVGIIDHGRIIALDSPKVLKSRIKEEDVVEVEVKNAAPDLARRIRSIEQVNQVTAQVTDPTVGAAALRVHAQDGRKVLPSVLAQIAAADGVVQFVKVSEPTLEDVFISLTGKALRD